MMPQNKPIPVRLILIVIALLSFWLRVWGIESGLPFIYHPDEQQYLLPGLGVLSGEFQPQTYHNPTLFPYLIGLVYGLTYLGLQTFNAFPEFFNLDVGWGADMQPWITGLVYLARYLSVASGLLTTLVVYHLGRRAYSQTTGLGAAIIFGLTFLPTRETHFAVNDAPTALGAAVALYLCLNILKRGYLRDYIGCGVALGVVAGTKYTGGLVVLPIIVAYLLSRSHHTWLQRVTSVWRLMVTAVISLLTFILVAPYTVLAWSDFWHDFTTNVQYGQQGFDALDLDPAGGLWFYLKSLGWGVGWPLFFLFLGAVLFVGWRRQRVDWVLLTLPLLGFLYLQRQQLFFARWLLLFIPALSVLTAEMIHTFVKWLQARFKVGGLTVNWLQNTQPLTLLIVILLTLPSSIMAGWANHVFSQQDTRTAALAWIGQNIPPGSNIAAEVLSPFWGPPLAMPGLGLGPYNFAPIPSGGVAEVDLQRFREWQVQYVVASSFYYGRVLTDKEHQASLAARMQTLDKNAELVAVFQPYDPEYTGFFYHDQVYGPANDALYRSQPGPIIKIYRLP